MMFGWQLISEDEYWRDWEISRQIKRDRDILANKVIGLEQEINRMIKHNEDLAKDNQKYRSKLRRIANVLCQGRSG